MSESPESGNTTRQHGARRTKRARATLPCLTVLCHPDVQRIGERALLTALVAGREIAISRTEPSFAHPGDKAPGRPLEDKYVSRTPLVLSRRASGLSLRGPNAGASVEGKPLTESVEVTPEDLSRGLLVTLADRIVLYLHETTNAPQTPIDGLVGASDAMASVRDELHRVAVADVSVLIRGETGTGKERVAEAIHRLSKRAAAAFVPVNMATIAESVAASTLFGHAKGAFTGAVSRHRGLFERASGGTLFLDELGDTPVPVQPMLLRAVETGRIVPIGDESERLVEVRFIAATDAPIDRDTETGTFRSALFHRLAGYEIHIPALRERRDDIARLFVHFAREELAKAGRADWLTSPSPDGEPRISAELIERLVHHPLPGNVRQLRNVVRSVLIACGDQEQLGWVPSLDRSLREAIPREPASRTSSPPDGALDIARLLSALERHGWAPGRAASDLGVATSTLHDAMRKAGIRRAADVPDAEVQRALRLHDNDVSKAARELRVSERALVLSLKHRSLRVGADV